MKRLRLIVIAAALLCACGSGTTEPRTCAEAGGTCVEGNATCPTGKVPSQHPQIRSGDLVPATCCVSGN